MKITVVDSNALQSVELSAYLRESRANRIAVPTLVSTEAFKQNPLHSVRARYAEIAKYPDQVFFLRDQAAFADRCIRSAHGARKLISLTDTRAFPDFVADLYADSPPQGLLDHIQHHHEDAKWYLSELEARSVHLDDLFRSLTKRRLTKDQRDAVRLQKAYSAEIIEYLFSLVREASIDLFRAIKTPRRRAPLTEREARNTFIYRYCLAMVLLYTRHVREGNLGGILNHVVDMQIVAQATFFSNIMTSDRNAFEIYSEARYLLRMSNTYLG